MLDYAGCVLNNWERLDPKGPIKPSNVRLLRRFTGLIDEEWFFKTHIIIESEGGHVAGALKSISAAMRNSPLTGCSLPPSSARPVCKAKERPQ
ncbi:Ido1 [Symbiodinium necroappetens]|uniref:Ido1 protein n=1 Tax=Symbiodinium necroappetens TaxID=1628268 RepID=A0A813BSY0_9DINO|nr:Ido1 [Symbiodinium necroappetens]